MRIGCIEAVNDGAPYTMKYPKNRHFDEVVVNSGEL
jgi:hypothetical protein